MRQADLRFHSNRVLKTNNWGGLESLLMTSAIGTRRAWLKLREKIEIFHDLTFCQCAGSSLSYSCKAEVPNLFTIWYYLGTPCCQCVPLLPDQLILSKLSLFRRIIHIETTIKDHN